MSQAETLTREEIYVLEGRRYAALVAGDWLEIEDLLSDDLVFTHSNAKVDDKASYLSLLRAGVVGYRTLEHSADTVISRPGVAIVGGRMWGSIEVNGAVLPMDSRVTAVWVAEDGQWRMTAFQGTPAPA